MANSKKECKYCRKYKPVSELVKVPAGTFCIEGDHVYLWLNQQQTKIKNRDAKAEKQKTAKEKREFNDNDFGHQDDLTQTAFNTLRRTQEYIWFYERNQEPTCISCGKPLGGDQFCNGHFKTRAAQSELRFDPLNSYLQHNRRCNQNLSGDIYGTKTTRGYIKGLHERFGEERALEIIEHCETDRKPLKISALELKGMRLGFLKEIKRLEPILDNLKTQYYSINS